MYIKNCDSFLISSYNFSLNKKVNRFTTYYRTIASLQQKHGIHWNDILGPRHSQYYLKAHSEDKTKNRLDLRQLERRSLTGFIAEHCKLRKHPHSQRFVLNTISEGAIMKPFQLARKLFLEQPSRNMTKFTGFL